MWAAQQHALRAGRPPVFAPDQRGHGGTPLGTGDPSLDVVADDLARALDGHGIDSAVLAGSSMGGYVAMAFLRRHPGRDRRARPARHPRRGRRPRDGRRPPRVRGACRPRPCGRGARRDARRPRRRDHPGHPPDVVARVAAMVEAADPAAVAWCTAGDRGPARLVRRALGARASRHRHWAWVYRVTGSRCWIRPIRETRSTTRTATYARATSWRWAPFHPREARNVQVGGAGGPSVSGQVRGPRVAALAGEGDRRGGGQRVADGAHDLVDGRGGQRRDVGRYGDIDVAGRVGGDGRPGRVRWGPRSSGSRPVRRRWVLSGATPVPAWATGVARRAQHRRQRGAGEEVEDRVTGRAGRRGQVGRRPGRWGRARR